jgi:hypothetical protein
MDCVKRIGLRHSGVSFSDNWWIMVAKKKLGCRG